MPSRPGWTCYSSWKVPGYFDVDLESKFLE
jgi:hypothetical protein